MLLCTSTTWVGSKRWLTSMALALLAISLSGCTPFNYTAADAPEPLRLIPLSVPRPRIALVLGAGGPRGYAHIGVMRALEDACIDIDLRDVPANNYPNSLVFLPRCCVVATVT